ncbi:MAG: ABC transporter permease [Bacteroidales bacterium]|nr:ABC transporter permease [Bacteroidales bacterium]
MRQFYIFVRKEFLHIFRDGRSVLILLLMPVIQIILFGFALTNEVKNVKVAIMDPSRDAATTMITERLTAGEYFKPYMMITTEQQADALLRRGEVSLIVNYSDRFRERLMHQGSARVGLTADGTDPNMASSIILYASSIIRSAELDIEAKNLQSGGVAIPNVRLLYNPQMKSSYNFVPGVMGLILMLICAMMTSISIVREKETGTMEVLLVSPVRPIFLILSKAVPYFVLSVVNLTTILLLSVFLLGVPVTGSLFWLVILSMIFIFVSLSMGLLISSIATTQVAAMLISGLVLMMPVMLLSGMIYPVSNMPEILQVIAQFIPAKWYIEAVRKLMIQGLPLNSVVTELSVLVAMAAIYLTASLRSFRDRLQ